MYAKYINGVTIEPFIGKVLVYNGRVFVNPTQEALKSAGYLPVLDGEKVTEIPENCEKRVVYEKRTDCIVVNEILVEVEIGDDAE